MSFRLPLAACGLAAVAACSQPSTNNGEPPPDGGSRVTSYELTSAADCDALRSRLSEATTEAILQAKYGGLPIDTIVGGKGDDSQIEQNDEEFEFETATAVQVEEEDVVKVDGELMYVLVDDALQIVRAAGDGTLTSVGRVGLGPSLRSAGMFVTAGHAVTFSRTTDELVDAAFVGTRVVVSDVSDPTKPQVVRQFDIEGDFEMARLVGGQIYVVTTATLRAGGDVWEVAYEDVGDLPAPEPGSSEARQVELRDSARAKVRALVDERLPTGEELLPRLRIDQETPRPLAGCSAVWGTSPIASVRLTSVTKFDVSSTPAATAIVGDRFAGHVVGSDFYLAFSDRWGDYAQQSRLHLFTLGSDQPAYVASGISPGTVVDQYSLTAAGDVARVITATDTGAQIRSFALDGGKLVESEKIAEIGDEGLVVANRFAGDNAFVATFGAQERIWSVALPAAQVKGPFELGGLATMIHSIGEDQILVVAQRANADGEMVGVELEIFDSNDASNAAASQSIDTGAYAAWSEAMWDPRSLAYDAARNLVAFPVNISNWTENGGQNFSGVLVYGTAGASLTHHASVDHAELQGRKWCLDNQQPEDCAVGAEAPWWTQVRRTVFLGDYLVTVSDVGAKSHRVSDFGEVSALLFP